MTERHKAQHLNKELETLARTHAPALRNFFQRRILEHADVEDLVQEVFFRLTRKGDLNDIRNLEGYIFQLAANLLRDRLRHRFVHQFNNHESLSDDQIDDVALSPERVLQGKEAVARLHKAIMALPERWRRVFVYSRIEGISQADVAKRLGISMSAVEKDLAKAMSRVMKMMKGVR